MESNMTDSEALSLAKRYQYFKARAGHYWEKQIWIKELMWQTSIIESLVVQERDSNNKTFRLEKEYQTLKLQLKTALSHVLHS